MNIKGHVVLSTLAWTGVITVLCSCGWSRTLPCGSFLDQASKAGEEHVHQYATTTI